MKKNKNFFILLLIFGVFTLLFLIRILPQPVQTQTLPEVDVSVEEKNVQRNVEIVPTAKSEVPKATKTPIVNSREITTYSSDEGYSFTTVPGWYLREFGSLYPRNIEFVAMSPGMIPDENVYVGDDRIAIEVSEKPYQDSLDARSHYTQFSEKPIVVDGVTGIWESGESQANEGEDGKKFVLVTLPLKEGTITIFASQKYEKEFNALVKSFKFKIVK